MKTNFSLTNIKPIYSKPKGRPRNDSKTTLTLLEKKSYKLLEKAIDLALKGNVSILVKLLDKILPTLERREAETILNINQQVSQLTPEQRKQRILELINKTNMIDAAPIQVDIQPVNSDDQPVNDQPINDAGTNETLSDDSQGSE